MNDDNTIYTIGHSNQSMDEFLALLHEHGIQVLVDVRSAPYSRWVPHFNKRELQQAIESEGLRYLYLGQPLGGRPENSQHLDSDGRALYYKMAQTPEFRKGIARLLTGMKDFRVALMCSEENPDVCHRNLLVGRVLREDHAVNVRHIRGDGTVFDSVDQPKQRSIFEEESEEDTSWKSLQSVSPESRRNSSSDS